MATTVASRAAPACVAAPLMAECVLLGRAPPETDSRATRASSPTRPATCAKSAPIAAGKGRAQAGGAPRWLHSLSCNQEMTQPIARA